jgi:hypothetical protein
MNSSQPAPNSSGSNYGSAQDWAQIISAAGSGISGAMQSNAALANSKKEAKQIKRKTLSNMLSQAMRRNQSVNRAGQEYSDEMADHQSQSLQQIARGFVDALQGISG